MTEVSCWECGTLPPSITYICIFKHQVGHRSNMSEREKTILVLSAVFQLRNLQLLGYFSTKKIKVE